MRHYFLYRPVIHITSNLVWSLNQFFLPSPPSLCFTSLWKSCSFIFIPYLFLLPLPSLIAWTPHPHHHHSLLLLCQSHGSSDSCFTLDKLHIWQPHVCPGSLPVLANHPRHTPLPHHHTQSHDYVLPNHRWDENLWHGNVTFPTNEAEISFLLSLV